VGATPQELKEQIDQTRADLAHTVDALAEKVTPGQTARRVSLVGAGLLVLLVLRSRLRRHSG
jgi:chaperonin GroEL (HSP60 family)